MPLIEEIEEVQTPSIPPLATEEKRIEIEVVSKDADDKHNGMPFFNVFVVFLKLLKII